MRLKISLLLGLSSIILFIIPLLKETTLAVQATSLNVVVSSSEAIGPNTLHNVLLNVTSGTTITFDTNVFPITSPTTIVVTAPLPLLNEDNIVIDASNAGVILIGSSAPANTDGLVITGNDCRIMGLAIHEFPGNGVVIWNGAKRNEIGGAETGHRNLISGNDQNGIWISGAGTDQNVILGNYIGTHAEGLIPYSNGFSGISIQNGAQANRIGGTAPGSSNLISGNQQNGIFISEVETTGNLILSNTIGLNKNGTGVIGQGESGIAIYNAQGNQIGNGDSSGRNLISGNTTDGISIFGSLAASNTIQGNFIGTDRNGTSALPNLVQGVRLSDYAHHNQVGGNRNLGQGNLLSGNGNHGVLINTYAHHNAVLGNTIGPDVSGTFSLGNHPFGGIDIAEGAHHNKIGSAITGEGNLISGNTLDGIALFDNTGAGTTDNEIVGNVIGLTLNGNSALPNIGYGIFHVLGTERTLIMSNTISGNLSDGVRLSGDSSMTSTVMYNIIGLDETGTFPIPNGQNGVLINESTSDHHLELNTISGNGLAGVKVTSCENNKITQNAIYANSGVGIDSICLSSPEILTITLAPSMIIGAMDRITGTAKPNARVEIYSDDEDEGGLYEGFSLANANGVFTFAHPRLTGPNITIASIDSDGNTSGFSESSHLLWTLLLYLNGDNDLEAIMFDIVDNIVSVGSSPRANVLALIDGYTFTTTYSGTVLYDLTRGHATPLNSSVAASFSGTSVITGERNMGDGQTLIDFVKWGQRHYPSRHSMLSVVDHGGGWAPSNQTIGFGALPRRSWFVGNSGLSWDFTSVISISSAGGTVTDFDYMDSREIYQAMADITDNGTDKLDVVFYDVCLMGLIEVGYQIKDFADYFVSSQNIGWAPLGPQGRYVQTIQNIQPTTGPREMAELLVTSYAAGNPASGHPFTVSAIDLTKLTTVTTLVNEFGLALSQTLITESNITSLQEAYSATQKLDYDSDFQIEPEDGFVDLYDFALKSTERFTQGSVISAANNLLQSLDIAIVAEAHMSDRPWILENITWNLDNVHGVSIYLPLGQDLEFSIQITETVTESNIITRPLRLRETYSAEELEFVADTVWDELIDHYYELVSSPVPTDMVTTSVDGLQIADITPPRTAISITGDLKLGQPLQISWTSVDTQTGVVSATLWHRPNHGLWTPIMTQSGSGGAFAYTPLSGCKNNIAVQATDASGNIESQLTDANSETVLIPFINPCQVNQFGNPGESVTTTLVLTNSTNETDTFNVTLVENTWATSASNAVGPLLPENSFPLMVNTTIPTNAVGGESNLVTITVGSQANNTISTTIFLTTTTNYIYEFYLTPISRHEFGDTGTAITYTLYVTNTGNTADVYTMTVDGGKWGADTPRLIQLPADGSVPLVVPINIPSNATDGEMDVVELTLTSSGDPAKSKIAIFTTTVKAYDFTLVPPAETRFGEKGEQVTYDVKITNVGNIADVYTLTVDGGNWATDTAEIISLTKGESYVLTVPVNIPSNAADGETDVAEITLTSSGDPAKSKVAIFTTTVEQYNFDVRPNNHSMIGDAGTAVTYELLITNTGNVPNMFKILIADYTWPSSTTGRVGPILPQLSATTTVTVVIPSHTSSDTSDTVMVSVISEDNDNQAITLGLTTSVAFSG
ncbi:MAG: clostripain-related cysteine peptidase, partial [Chloroflexota bacterium]